MSIICSVLVMGKQLGRLGFPALVWVKEENSEFKPAVLRLKIDLVSRPSRGKGIE